MPEKLKRYIGNINASGVPFIQGALFEKTAPWTAKLPQKLFINMSFVCNLEFPGKALPGAGFVWIWRITLYGKC